MGSGQARYASRFDGTLSQYSVFITYEKAAINLNCRKQSLLHFNEVLKEMGVCNIFLRVAVFAFVPFWMHLLNGCNYYYDYITALFEPDPPDLFDFIVGKLYTMDCSAQNCAMDWD